MGLHEEGSHRVVEFDPCLQLSAGANAAVARLRRTLASRPALASRLRALDLAESPDERDLVVGVRGDLRTSDAPTIAAAAAEVPGITGLGFGTGREGGGPFVLLRGDPHIHAEVLGRRLRAHLRSFFQANRFLLEDLARTVVGMVPVGGPILDLYSGVGLFSIPLAARGDEVRGAEIGESATRDAIANARGIPSVRFSEASVGEALARWPCAGGERVVLDPPRTGAGPEVVAAVAARRPSAVVYVSCDPPTLGRDLLHFARAGLRPERIVAFDMFPDTFHVEAVVRLVPAA
jgi:tRNA/tmRNA/rRNA uracil-C5-methylase (TrmA/RlmC/RlmD family)